MSEATTFEQNAFSPVQFARRNSLGKSKVYELLNAGKITAKKDGRRTLITAESERAWLASLPNYESKATAA